MKTHWIQIWCLVLGYSVTGMPSFVASQELPFRYYGVNEGLGVDIRAFTQDDQGYLWVASWKGLGRFDGQQFKFFTIKDGLPDNDIRTMLVDQKGALWIGTRAGISNFDGTNFTNYSTTDGLRDNYINSIAEDQNGDLWFGTLGGGISRYREGVFTTFTTEDGLPSNTIQTLLIDRAGTLWIGTNNGLGSYDGNTYTTYSVADGLGGRTVNAIVEDEQGILWIGTNNGLSKYTENRFVTYTEANGLVYNNVLSLQIDRSGVVWVGTGRGASKYHEGQFISIREKHGLIDTQIFCIFKDQEANLWFGTLYGIYQLSNFALTSYTKLSGLDIDDILAVQDDRDGNIWFGARTSGICKLSDGVNVTHTIADTLKSLEIQSALEDRQGNLWFGTRTGELFKLNGTDLIAYGADLEFSGDVILDLLEDTEGYLWLGTARNGVYKYNPVDGSHIVYSMQDGLAGNRVFKIHEDANGTFWFGTVGGVNRLTDETLSTIVVGATRMQHVVRTVVEDETGNFWFGTLMGLFQYNGSVLTEFMPSTELSSRSFTAMLYTNGYLYAGTEKGFLRINPATEETIILSSSTNPFSSMGNLDTIIEDASGCLWFGTRGGLLRYDPLFDYTNTVPPPIQVTSVTVGGEDTVTAAEIAIPYRDNQFAVHYAGLSYAEPEKVSYRYQLTGFEDDWTETANRFVSYTNLDPGDYVFNVMACNNDGVWSEAPASIAVTITPAYWQTWWFRALALLVVGMVIHTGHLMRTRRYRKHNVELQQEIVERERIEKELKEAYGIVNLSPVVAFVWKNENNWPVEFVTDNVKEMLGYTAEEFVSGSVRYADLIHSDDLDTVTEEVTKNSSHEGVVRFAHEPYRLVTKNGDIIWLDDRTVIKRDAHGDITHYQGIILDITERKKSEKEKSELEAQLQQAQKMDAIGQLAGGVAHDFNNLLTAIVGYSEMALMECEPNSPIHGDMEEIMKVADRATALVRQLLAFSRKQVLELEDLNLDEVVSDLAKMVQRLIGEQIAFNIISEPGLKSIRADKGQIEQVIMNLCINARDAMAEGGRLTIETSSTELNEEYCNVETWANPGSYVVLSIADTGCGMDDETRQRIFEPFYTTKEQGKGTGLGLSTVFGIVQQHNGIVHVYSEVGSGTIFRIFFPLSEEGEYTSQTTSPEPLPGGTETILLADDDEDVRRIGEKILRMYGYTVLIACDGEEAIRIFDENADVIDLALLDVIMPKLGGKAVCKHIREKRPQTHILFVSGYSTGSFHDGLLDENLAVIQKPYHREILLRKVREVLDDNSNTDSEQTESE